MEDGLRRIPPRHGASMSSRTPAGPRRGTRRAPTRRVLLVDDERDILEGLREFFRDELPGVEILIAESGEEAQDTLGTAPVDVILSDQRMPGINGLDLMEDVRRSSPDTRRILMTAFGDLEMATQAINKGIVHRFFTKPLDPDEVLDCIRSDLVGPGRD